jgi:hypothetical protein
LFAPLIKAHATSDVTTLAEAEQLGLQVAAQLRALGAA